MTNWVADGGIAPVDDVLAHVVAFSANPPDLSDVEEAVNALVDAGLLSIDLHGFRMTAEGKELVDRIRRVQQAPRRQARLQTELRGVPTGKPGAVWRLGADEWSTVLLQHQEEQRNGLQARRAIVDGLMYALERMDEINAVVRAAPDRLAAVSILTKPPFPFTEIQAHHVLDTTVSQQTVDARAALEEESARLGRQISALDET